MAFDDSNLYGKAYGIDQRGRHGSFGKALDAALADLLTERNDFYDSLVDRWADLFPGFAARPGRYEDGRIYLYAKSAPAMFALRPKLKAVREKLRALPDAPAKIDLRLEIHTT